MSRRTWTIIADDEMQAWRDEISREYPMVSPHKIARMCLRYGLRRASATHTIVEDESECVDLNRHDRQFFKSAEKEEPAPLPQTEKEIVDLADEFLREQGLDPADFQSA